LILVPNECCQTYITHCESYRILKISVANLCGNSKTNMLQFGINSN